MTHSCYDSPVTNRGHKAMTKKKKKNDTKKKKKKKKTLVQRAENLHITNACITFFRQEQEPHTPAHINHNAGPYFWFLLLCLVGYRQGKPCISARRSKIGRAGGGGGKGSKHHRGYVVFWQDMPCRSEAPRDCLWLRLPSALSFLAQVGSVGPSPWGLLGVLTDCTACRC